MTNLNEITATVAVQTLNKQLIQLLKRSLKTIDKLAKAIEYSETSSPLSADVRRVHRDLIETRVSIRTALRNLGVSSEPPQY